jgi:hypothetical protein
MCLNSRKEIIDFNAIVLFFKTFFYLAVRIQPRVAPARRYLKYVPVKTAMAS